jgi:CSLREA domain-containing protein
VPCLAVALAVSAFAAPSAAAATGKAFTVNSTADAPDANLANGTCATSTGTCTLRAAIMQANHTAAADTIKLPKGRAGT